MATYFITRHEGAVEWAWRQGISAERRNHLDVELINAGDVVIGTLPVNLAADVIARGGRYIHLSLPTPPDRRGSEISADEMDEFGAALMEYHVVRVDNGHD